MLDLKPNDLKQIDVSDFMDMVEGKLLWTEEEIEMRFKEQEHTLDWQAWFAANLMVSSGNFKKNVKPGDIKNSLFKTQEELKKESEVNKKRDAEEERARVVKAFGLSERTEN